MEVVLDWLLRQYPTAKRQTLRRMVQEGRVLVDERPCRTIKDAISATSQVRVAERRPAAVPDPAGAPAIVFEDDDLLVVDKPPGLLSSTVPRERRPTLLARVEQYLARTDRLARVGLIHRLDRDAAGLLIFSKNDAAYRSLKTQFYEHTVRREYSAAVYGVPAPRKDQIRTMLVERADGVVYSTRQHGRGQIAVSDYEVLAAGADRSLLRVVLQTGRKHQIRVHLSGRGHPIVGDAVYGRAGSAAGRLLLCATGLEIEHPRTGGRRRFELPVPEEFRPA